MQFLPPHSVSVHTHFYTGAFYCAPNSVNSYLNFFLKLRTSKICPCVSFSLLWSRLGREPEEGVGSGDGTWVQSACLAHGSLQMTGLRATWWRWVYLCVFRVCVRVCVWIYVSVGVCITVSMYVYIVCVYMYVYICVYMCV